jgi:hypothetical protein
MFHVDYHADPTDWIPGKILMEEMERELTQKRTHLLRRVSNWMTAVSIFQRIEHKRMVENEPSLRDFEFHKALGTFYHGVGEMLLLELQEQKSIDPKWIGMSFEGFAAAVRSLGYSLRMWHSDMSEAEREGILDAFKREGP